MKKFFANILCLILGIPFYGLVLICCFYSFLWSLILNKMQGIEAYEWFDRLNKWVRKYKNKFLGKQ